MNPQTLFATTWYQPQCVVVQSAPTVGVTIVASAYAWQWQSVGNQLVEYSHYSDNWDGMGGQVAPQNAFGTAFQLLNASRQNNGLAPTTAALSPSGTIQLEWWLGENVLQAEIFGGNRIDWIEFGPNSATRHWSEAVSLAALPRGNYWPSSDVTEERGVVSASGF